MALVPDRAFAELLRAAKQFLDTYTPCAESRFEERAEAELVMAIEDVENAAS